MACTCSASQVLQQKLLHGCCPVAVLLSAVRAGEGRRADLDMDNEGCLSTGALAEALQQLAVGFDGLQHS